MDVASNAVSLIRLTVIGLAFICQTFSSIKDGPKTVSYIAKNVQNLLHILERLSNNAAVMESQDAVLSDMLKSCHDDVTRMAQELDKCNFKATDKTGLKLWRSGKSMFKEKEWADFQAKLHGYSSSLSTIITIEHSEKLFDIDRKMDGGHTLIREELLRISNKCDRIEIKCEKVGSASRNSQLQYTPASLPSLPLQAPGIGIETRENTPPMVTERRRWTFDEVMANSRCLEDFFSRDRILLSSQIIKPPRVNKKTLDRLLRWSRASPSPQTLWIKGPYTATRDSENHMTKIGLKLVNLAYERCPNFPMISFFCQLSPAKSLKLNETAEMGALTAVLYALIRQILEILSLPLVKDIDLTESRFQRLDGTKSACKEALLILEDLVGHITQPVFCILDGLQWLEHISTRKHMRKLLEVLRHKYLHVLYITTGSVASLGDTISKDETLGEQDLRDRAVKEDLGRQSQKFWT